MKKVLVYGPRDLRIEEFPERSPGPGEVKAKMLFSTLTTANVHRYTLPPREGGYPITISYTGSARVIELGDGVTTHKVGDLVYPNFYRSCGHCEACEDDRISHCEKLTPGQMQMMVSPEEESGLQDYVIFPAWRMRRVAPEASVENVALIGFASVAVHAVEELNLQDGETVLINGAGPIGWAAIQAARNKGCRVVATEIDPARAALAERFGAAVVVDGNAPDAAEQVRIACGSDPVRIVEATGTMEGSTLAFAVAGRGAHMSIVGTASYPIQQPEVVISGLTLHGIAGGSNFDETIDLIGRGVIDTTASISHRFPFDQVKEAIDFKTDHKEAQLVGVTMGD